MLFDHPGHFRAHIGADDAGGNLGVVIGRQFIADIVDQGGGNHFRIGTISLGPTGGLQRMLQATDLVAIE